MSNKQGEKISDLRPLNALTGAIWFEVIRRIGEEGDGKYENRRIHIDLLRELSGRDGKSAFEVAQSLGFEGTETEWLESIVGPQGPAGQDGPQGPAGQDGTNGVDGKDGQDGKDGTDGRDGTNGIDGQDGQDGRDGQDGSDGTNGVDGQDGQDGQDGSDGESAYQIDVRVNGYDGTEEEWLEEVKSLGQSYDFQADVGTSVDEWRSIIRTVMDAFSTEGMGVLVKDVDGVDFKQLSKDHVGLGNVDNTSDVDKPLSNAVIEALGNKVTRDSLDTLLTGYLKVTSVVDSLTSTDADAPLSANQGRVLKEAVDSLTGIFGENEPSQEFYDAIQMILNGDVPITAVGGLQEALDALEARLEALETGGGDGSYAEDIANLKTRVEALEAADGGSVDLTEIENELTSIKQRLDTLEVGDGGDPIDPDVSEEINTIKDRLTTLEADMDGKVDKVAGKGLSTNDFTDAHRTKLDSLDESGGGGSSYTHPTGFASNSVATQSGPTVISRLTVNDEGHVTGTEERDLTAGDLGAASENHTHDGRYYTRDEIDALIADSSGGGDSGSGGGSVLQMVRTRRVIMRGSLEAIIIVTGFGTQAEIDAVTVQEMDAGGKIRVDNVTGSLQLNTVTIFYDDGWNSTQAFRLEYPDNWGDTFMGDMVIPTMVYYSRSNPPTIQPLTNISYGHDGGYNVVARPGLIADRGYHFKYSLI